MSPRSIKGVVHVLDHSILYFITFFHDRVHIRVSTDDRSGALIDTSCLPPKVLLGPREDIHLLVLANLFAEIQNSLRTIPPILLECSLSHSLTNLICTANLKQEFIGHFLKLLSF
jgi:hypothetical protein